MARRGPSLVSLAATVALLAGACQNVDRAAADGLDLAEGEILELATYPVLDGGQLGEADLAAVDGAAAALRDDRSAHESAWELWTAVAPDRWESLVRELRMVTDGPEGDLAGVVRIDLDEWILELDAADLEAREELEHTLVHELAHLISLAPGQIVPEDPPLETLVEAVARCAPLPAVEEGCLGEGSYLGVFVERFWTTEDLVAADEISWDDDPDALSAERYDEAPERWITDYAASHPEEDFAESWVGYVLYEWETEDPDAPWVQKAAFFDTYPELRAARDEIWSTLGLG